MTEANPFIGGGNIAQLPKPYRRFYDDKRRKRPVTIKIICYGDYGGLGTHYYVTVQEENDPIWDAAEKAWRSAWDDEKGKGKKFEKKFSTNLAAEEYVRKIVAKHFLSRTHKLRDWIRNRVWHYREDN